MSKRIKLIANPISGGDSRPRIQKACACLEHSGAQVDLFLTGKRGDARECAAQLDVDQYDLVLAAGGDGTLNEVANGLAGRGLPLAFLPLGTANVMALEMGLPSTLEGACQVALTGSSKPVCLVRANADYFLMMVGAGFDAAAVRAVNARLKRITGKLAYLVAGVQAFLRGGFRAFKIQAADGESFTAWHAIISNIRLYGGRFEMVPGGGLETICLTACVVDRPGRIALLQFWLRILLRGRLLGAVRRIESGSFQLIGDGVPLQIDGDDVGNIPLNISCEPGKLTLLFPETLQQGHS